MIFGFISKHSQSLNIDQSIPVEICSIIRDYYPYFHVLQINVDQQENELYYNTSKLLYPSAILESADIRQFDGEIYLNPWIICGIIQELH